MGRKKAETCTGMYEQMLMLALIFLNNVMLPHLSEGFLVFWVIKVGTDLLLLHSFMFKSDFWMLTSAPDFSAHQRCGLWGQREGERVIRCGSYTWSYKIVQGVCSYPGCCTEENRHYKPQGTPLCLLVQNVYPWGLQERPQPGERI